MQSSFSQHALGWAPSLSSEDERVLGISVRGSSLVGSLDMGKSERLSRVSSVNTAAVERYLG